MGRDEDIQAIVEIGRQTRRPTPRWLWIASAIMGVLCIVCFAAMVLGGGESASHPASQPPDHAIAPPPATDTGLGIGLVIGAAAGFVLGFSIGRQRRSHSSRNRP